MQLSKVHKKLQSQKKNIKRTMQNQGIMNESESDCVSSWPVASAGGCAPCFLAFPQQALLRKRHNMAKPSQKWDELLGKDFGRHEKSTDAAWSMSCHLRRSRRRFARGLEMYPLDVVSHVVYPTKHPVASFPVTQNAWVVFCLVSRKILFTREAASCGLWTVTVAAKERLCVSLVVFPQITPPSEDCS